MPVLLKSDVKRAGGTEGQLCLELKALSASFVFALSDGVEGKSLLSDKSPAS